MNGMVGKETVRIETHVSYPEQWMRSTYWNCLLQYSCSSMGSDGPSYWYIDYKSDNDGSLEVCTSARIKRKRTKLGLD